MAENAQEQSAPAEKEENYSETTQQKPGGEEQKPQSFIESLTGNPFILVLLGLWILVLWTARKSKKKQQDQREQQNSSLVKGAKVVTIGRVHGTVIKVNDKTFTIKTDPNKDYTMTFDREALLRVEGSEAGDEAEATS